MSCSGVRKRTRMDGLPQLPRYGTTGGDWCWTLGNCSRIPKVRCRTGCAASTPGHDIGTVYWFGGCYQTDRTPRPRARAATSKSNQRACKSPPHPQHQSCDPLGSRTLGHPREWRGWPPVTPSAQRPKLHSTQVNIHAGCELRQTDILREDGSEGGVGGWPVLQTLWLQADGQSPKQETRPNDKPAITGNKDL